MDGEFRGSTFLQSQVEGVSLGKQTSKQKIEGFCPSSCPCPPPPEGEGCLGSFRNHCFLNKTEISRVSLQQRHLSFKQMTLCKPTRATVISNQKRGVRIAEALG